MQVGLLSRQSQRTWPHGAPGEVRVGHEEGFLQGWSHTGTRCRGRRWSCHRGRCVGKTGHDTRCHGLVDMLEIGPRFAPAISEVSPGAGSSTIL